MHELRGRVAFSCLDFSINGRIGLLLVVEPTPSFFCVGESVGGDGTMTAVFHWWCDDC